MHDNKTVVSGGNDGVLKVKKKKMNFNLQLLLACF